LSNSKRSSSFEVNGGVCAVSDGFAEPTLNASSLSSALEDPADNSRFEQLLSEVEHMKLFHGNRTLAMMFFPLISVEMLLAAPPDLTLLSLVPPGAQIVAGITNRPSPGKPGSFLLMTRNSVIDHRDFISLAGVDNSMIIRQMIFASGGSDTSKFGEHSLLISGHFDQARIFKAAVENGATVTEFRGFRVLVQHPFERELGTFKDVRWLAVIDSNVALFGTRSSVQQELDRHLSGSAVDLSLMQKLDRLRRDDATWSVLGMFKFDDEIEHALGSLDPILATLVHAGTSFLFGVRYGRKIEVEYEGTVPSSESPHTYANSSMESLVAGNLKGSSLLPHPDLTGERASVRGVVKVAIDRYAAWLAEVDRTGLIRGQ
jgi:hypothetical protein